MLLEKVSIHTEILFVHCYNFFFYYYLFFFCVCILLPKGINEFVVFLCIVHVWFLLFTLLPRFLLKGQFFSQNKNSVSECILIFICKNVASKSLYKIHPFPLMLMQRNEMIHVYTVRNLINNLISLSYCSQLFQRNGCIRYSTIKKKKATCIEYSAIRVTSFVS